MNDLDYLRLSKPQKFVHNLKKFFASLPKRVLGALKGLVMWFVGLFKKIGLFCADLVKTYVQGDWKTKVSYTVMGFGSIARGQWLRGILFFLFQTVFNLYVWFFGAEYLGKLSTLGTVETMKKGRVTVYGDNSFLILLYGVLTIFFVIAFLYTWYVNVKQNKLSEKILKSGKKLKSAKDDMASLLDNQFHKTLLALPTIGVFVFTILPIIFMILVAFTNYDNQHQPPGKLFTWVGTENFQTLLSSPDEKVVFDVTSSTAESAALTITAKNGDILTVSTADVAAAEAAEKLEHSVRRGARHGISREVAVRLALGKSEGKGNVSLGIENRGESCGCDVLGIPIDATDTPDSRLGILTDQVKLLFLVVEYTVYTVSEKIAVDVGRIGALSEICDGGHLHTRALEGGLRALKVCIDIRHVAGTDIKRRRPARLLKLLILLYRNSALTAGKRRGSKANGTRKGNVGSRIAKLVSRGKERIELGI